MVEIDQPATQQTFNVQNENDPEISAGGAVSDLWLLCIHREPAQLSMLEEHGYEMVTAANGHEGLRLFMTKPVDVIVLEYHLGLMDGAVIGSEIKHVCPQVPIVMLIDNLELPEDALQSVDAIVAKSDGPQFLLATIRFVLNVNRLRAVTRSHDSSLLRRLGLQRNVLINWVYFHVLGSSRVAQSQHVASDVMSVLIGNKGAEWMTLAMIVSAFGSLHVNLLGGPRVPYAMARDGVFFSFAKRVQPKFHTPSGAVIFHGCVAILFVLSGTYQELYSLAMFAIWIFFALTAVALIRLRSTESELPRPYRVWGYPWTPIIFGTAAFGISLNLWMTRPIRSSIGLAVILLGIPFFYYWCRRAVHLGVVEATTLEGT